MKRNWELAMLVLLVTAVKLSGCSDDPTEDIASCPATVPSSCQSVRLTDYQRDRIVFGAATSPVGSIYVMHYSDAEGPGVLEFISDSCGGVALKVPTSLTYKQMLPSQLFSNGKSTAIRQVSVASGGAVGPPDKQSPTSIVRILEATGEISAEFGKQIVPSARLTANSPGGIWLADGQALEHFDADLRRLHVQKLPNGSSARYVLALSAKDILLTSHHSESAESMMVWSLGAQGGAPEFVRSMGITASFCPSSFQDPLQGATVVCTNSAAEGDVWLVPVEDEASKPVLVETGANLGFGGVLNVAANSHHFLLLASVTSTLAGPIMMALKVNRLGEVVDRREFGRQQYSVRGLEPIAWLSRQHGSSLDLSITVVASNSRIAGVAAKAGASAPNLFLASIDLQCLLTTWGP